MNTKQSIRDVLKELSEYFQSVEHFDTKAALAEDKEVLDEAQTQLLNIIESVIPEPDKHTWRAYGQPDGTVVCDHCNLAEDVNNLLSSQVADIKSKLIGEE